MPTVNYQGIREALHYRESFQHGSCHAERRESSEHDRYPFPGVYLVWSYSTLILRYSLAESRVLMFDNRQYSQTTSRLQSLIRAAFPDATSGYSDRVVYDRCTSSTIWPDSHIPSRYTALGLMHTPAAKSTTIPTKPMSRSKRNTPTETKEV